MEESTDSFVVKIREIVEKIDAAVQNCNQYRTARRLLDRADVTGSATVEIEWADYLRLSGCSDRQAALRHLTVLSSAGIIHFSTNQRVYITFHALTGIAFFAHRARATRPLCAKSTQ